MRIHPISLALSYLNGQKTVNGRVVFSSEDEAIETLHNMTGQDFGQDAKRWGEWLRKNRWVYYRTLRGPGIWVTVVGTGSGSGWPEESGGWTVETRDGRRLRAFITAKVHTLKIPSLQVGDNVRVWPFPNDAKRCSIDLEGSPVVWISSSNVERIAAKSIRPKRTSSRKFLR